MAAIVPEAIAESTGAAGAESSGFLSKFSFNYSDIMNWNNLCYIVCLIVIITAVVLYFTNQTEASIGLVSGLLIGHWFVTCNDEQKDK